MTRYWVTVVIFFLSSWSHATPNLTPMKTAPPGALSFYLLNPEIRFERGEEQDLAQRRPINFGISYFKRKYSVLLEYGRFTEKTGNGVNFIERAHQDLMIWGRYHYFSHRDASRRFNTYLNIGAGAGGYDEEIKSHLMGEERTDKSKVKLVSGLSGGIDFSYLVSDNVALVMGLEGRAFFANDYDPNPLWGAILRMGFSINL